MAKVGDSVVVLELFHKKIPAEVRLSDELALCFRPIVAKQGDCGAGACRQAESSVAGVKLQDFLISGEVIS